MKSQNHNSITRIIRAFGYSVQGLRATFLSEQAFRQEVLLCIILLPVIIFLPINLMAKALLIFSFALILVAELTNSAIEVVVDYISEDKHLLAKKAKDIGGAVVLVTFLNAFIIWAILLWDLVFFH